MNMLNCVQQKVEHQILQSCVSYTFYADKISSNNSTDFVKMLFSLVGHDAVLLVGPSISCT